MPTHSGTAERPIAQANEAALQALPFADRDDFEDARRGFLGTIDPMRIENADGRDVWDMDAYAFVEGDPPPTVHPSLWRQAQLAGDPRPVRCR
jgi:alkyl sulfatase BDS1-like metallo-beta-lactamase superfamily hydrolase